MRDEIKYRIYNMLPTAYCLLPILAPLGCITTNFNYT
jgi:hypothetical protein